MAPIAFRACISAFLLIVASVSESQCNSVKMLDGQYFRGDNVESSVSLTNGVRIDHWSQNAAGFSDGTLVPPIMNRIEIPPKKSYPQYGTPYWLEHRVSYVVTNGEASIFDANNTWISLTGGDHFSSAAGIVHGPITNTGSTALTVLVMGVLAPRFISPPAVFPVETRNWPAQAATKYHDAPNNHSGLPPLFDNCGAVKVNMDSKLLTGIDSLYYDHECDFPMHYHPIGAVYFMIKGRMTRIGDVGAGSRAPFVSGEAVWVRPGFSYKEHMEKGTQFLVMGAPPLPTAGRASNVETYVARRQVTMEVSYKNTQDASYKSISTCKSDALVGRCLYWGCFLGHGKATCHTTRCVCDPGFCSYDGYTCVHANTTASYLELGKFPSSPEPFAPSSFLCGAVVASFVAGIIFAIIAVRIGGFLTKRPGASLSEALLQ